MSVFARVGVCSCRCLLVSVFARGGKFLYITRAAARHRSVRNNLFTPSPCPCLLVLVVVSVLASVLVSVLVSILVSVLVSVLEPVLASVLDSVLVSVLSSSSSAARLPLCSSARLLPARRRALPLAHCCALPLARHRAVPPTRRYLEPCRTLPLHFVASPIPPSSGTMSTTNPEPETKHQLPPILREIPPAFLEQIRQIALNESFAPGATLEAAYTQVRTLVEAILNSQEAAPAWRIDDLKEQLAAARRAIDQLATLEGQLRYRAERVPDPATFDGSRENLEGFIVQPCIKLFSDPSHFPTPTLRMRYAFNRLEGRAQTQILPFIQNGVFQLNDSDDIIRILEATFGHPDPAATARTKLYGLKQGKKEFTAYFAEFQMLVSKLSWDEHAKLDALR